MKGIRLFAAGLLVLTMCSVVRPEQVCKNGVCSFDPDKNSKSKDHKSPETKNGAVIELTGENFESFIKDAAKPVIVDFYAEWCGPCKNMKPIFAELAQQETDYIFASMDSDKNPSIMRKYGFSSLPTFGVFKNGTLWEKITGWMPKEQLLKHIQEIVRKNSPAAVSQSDLLMELFMAISERNIPAIKKSLASNVDVNGKLETPQGTITAFAVAVMTGTNEIIDLLVKAGAKMDKALEESIKKQLETSDVVIENLQKNLEYCKNKLAAQKTPVKQAVKMSGQDLGMQFMQAFGNPEQLKKLIEQGADVNVVFPLGKNQVTPLYMALAINNQPLMDMLIDAGANLSTEIVNEHGVKVSIENAIKEEIETSKLGMIKGRERLAYAASKCK